MLFLSSSEGFDKKAMACLKKFHHWASLILAAKESFISYPTARKC